MKTSFISPVALQGQYLLQGMGAPYPNCAVTTRTYKVVAIWKKDDGEDRTTAKGH